MNFTESPEWINADQALKTDGVSLAVEFRDYQPPLGSGIFKVFEEINQSNLSKLTENSREALKDAARTLAFQGNRMQTFVITRLSVHVETGSGLRIDEGRVRIMVLLMKPGREIFLKNFLQAYGNERSESVLVYLNVHAMPHPETPRSSHLHFAVITIPKEDRNIVEAIAESLGMGLTEQEPAEPVRSGITGQMLNVTYPFAGQPNNLYFINGN
jgi:hypothetical protein